MREFWWIFDGLGIAVRNDRPQRRYSGPKEASRGLRCNNPVELPFVRSPGHPDDSHDVQADTRAVQLSPLAQVSNLRKAVVQVVSPAWWIWRLCLP